MGNESSSLYITDPDWPKNSLGFYITEVPEVDEIFQDAADVFDEFENHRIQIKTRLKRVHRLAGTEKLKEQNVLEAIKVLLWSLASIGNGDIETVTVGARDHAMKFELVEEYRIHTTTWRLFEALEDLLKYLNKILADMSKTKEKVDELLEMMNDLRDTSDLENYGDKYHISKSVLREMTEKNMEIFIGMYKVMFAWHEFAIKLSEGYNMYISNTQYYFNEANSMGENLSKKKLIDPKEIFELFNQVDLFSM